MPSTEDVVPTRPPGRRRPGRPPNSEGEETRRQILAAAARCFTRTGYDATSMATIAEEAGLTRTAIYNYFRTRVDLARAVLFENVAVSTSEGFLSPWWTETGVDDLSARERLRGLLRAGVDDALATLRMGDFYMTLVRESAADPQLRKVLRDYVGGLRAAVLGLLRDAVASGELPADADTDALLDSVLGMAWALSSGLATAPDDRVRRQVFAALDLVLTVWPWTDSDAAGPPFTPSAPKSAPIPPLSRSENLEMPE